MVFSGVSMSTGRRPSCIIGHTYCMTVLKRDRRVKMKRQRNILIILLVVVVLLGVFADRVIPGVLAAGAHASGESGAVTFLENERYFETLLATFSQAREEIVLAVYLFKTNGYRANYPDRIVASLGEAAKRGVKVLVLLESTGDRDSFIERANRETAERLREAGVSVEFDQSSERTHIKMIVVDRRILFVGSHNMTNSGLKYNNEASLMVVSPRLADEALAYIGRIERER